MREVRETLFRAKRVDTDEWIEGYYCLCVFGSFPAEPCIICADELKNGKWQPVRVSKGTLCEYTGLKDKKGRRIFEGDIVSCPSNVCRPLFNYDIARETYIYEVVYQDELTAFIMKNKDKQALSYEYLLLFGTVDKCEVVGNIYDN